MKIATSLLLITFFTILNATVQGQKYDAIYSGLPWFDDKGNTVSAHGANIVFDNNRYYLFGERHTDTSNAFAGFNCYSSADLYNWKFESTALPLQPSGKLGAGRVGERPKVMKCPATGEYIMYMHVDTLGYKDQLVGYATAQNITGPYTFRGALLFNQAPIRKWDMGAFQDTDGKGYILLHGGDIYQLSDDYKSITEHVNKAMVRGFESPALFRKDSIYFFLGSDLTGWERNDNYYFTATSLKGPWTRQGFIAPEETLTWNSQTTFVLPVQGTAGTTYMFMGDRWSFPRQASAATYIWQPLAVDGHNIAIPAFSEAWRPDTKTGTHKFVSSSGKMITNSDDLVNHSGTWKRDTLSVISSDSKGASFTVSVSGRQIGFYGLSRPDGGYAKVVISNNKGKIVLTSYVDMYSKYATAGLKFLSPLMPENQYTMKVTVLGERWYWVEKSGRRSGSKGDMVSLDKVVIR